MNTDVLGAGQVFAGRYRIERFLAQGGFGAVYVAEQLATEARVAVKVLWPHVLQARDAVEKFQQEARIAGRVNSDNIVRVIDAGYDDATSMPFLVMELLEGEDLAHTVEREGPLPPALVVEYLRQTASALDRAHAYVDRNGVPHPIVHRDLKPENLFLARRDDGGQTVKVLDFGIAKILNSTSDVSRDVKGTPLFMAFEQAAGAPITPRTDVWALGLIAFYLLTAQSYWNTARQPDSALMQLFAEVLSLPLVPASTRLGEIGVSVTLPPRFDAWFEHCVNRDAAQRFASAGAAIAELAAAYDIVPAVSSANPSLPGAAPTPGTAVADPGAGSASLATAGTALMTPDAIGATDRSLAVAGTLVSAKPRRSPVLPIVGAIAALVLVGGGVAMGVALTRSRPAAGAGAGSAAEPRAAAGSAAAPATSTVAAPPAASSASAAASAPVAAKPKTPAHPVATRPVHRPVHVARPAHRVAKPSKDNGVYGER